MKNSVPSRVDYMLIWTHGLVYTEQILALVENEKGIDIKKVLYHKPRSIKKLVNHIYSYDYAPLKHLKSKVKYLMKLKGEVLFVFFENQDPQVDYFGEGAFRHIESQRIRSLKAKIRDQYNPRDENGSRTENHVVHFSDNELQSDYILKYLGFNDGVRHFQSLSEIVRMPHHLEFNQTFVVKEVQIDTLYCNVLGGEMNKPEVNRVSICSSPHYLGMKNEMSIYSEYLNKYRGRGLTDFYSVRKFQKLINNFDYLSKFYSDAYILVRDEDGTLVIQDGLHRAVILKSQGCQSTFVAVIK